MTPEEHELTQTQFIVQTAMRMGLDSTLPVAELLTLIRQADQPTHELLVALRDAYRGWYEASNALGGAAKQGASVEALRVALIKRITERDSRRSALVGHLDKRFPYRPMEGPDADIVAASGVPH